MAAGAPNTGTWLRGGGADGRGEYDTRKCPTLAHANLGDFRCSVPPQIIKIRGWRPARQTPAPGCEAAALTEEANTTHGSARHSPTQILVTSGAACRHKSSRFADGGRRAKHRHLVARRRR